MVGDQYPFTCFHVFYKTKLELKVLIGFISRYEIISNTFVCVIVVLRVGSLKLIAYLWFFNQRFPLPKLVVVLVIRDVNDYVIYILTSLA